MISFEIVNEKGEKQIMIIDSVNHLSSIESGTMIFGKIKSDIALFIKDAQWRIDMIPESSISIEIRSCNIILDDVALVPFMIQISGNPLLTYLEWLNFYDEDTRQCFYDLATQELINIIFFSENIYSSRGFSTPNNVQVGYKTFIHQLKCRVPWTFKDFEYTKSKLLRKYPTTISLWNGLKKLTGC